MDVIKNLQAARWLTTRLTVAIGTTVAALILLSAGPASAQQAPANSAAEKSVLLARSEIVPKDVPTAVKAGSNYVIGPEDLLDVSVWKEPDLTRTVPVRPDGKISLPLLNDVQAAGETPTQLAASITDSLKRYVTDPQVTIIVSAINSQRIYLLGEVTRPGAYPLIPGMTLLQALSSAGGLTQYARAQKIYVLRGGDKSQQRLGFNYKEFLKGKNPEQNVALRVGDTIVVP
jgi:polysaccharide export outer membrane protein